MIFALVFTIDIHENVYSEHSEIQIVAITVEIIFLNCLYVTKLIEHVRQRFCKRSGTIHTIKLLVMDFTNLKFILSLNPLYLIYYRQW